MIHDDHTTLLEVTFEPKCTDLDAKHFLWMGVYVYENHGKKFALKYAIASTNIP